MKAKKTIAALAASALVALLATAGPAGAVFDQKGNLQGSFNGQIAPAKLPRQGSAPVAVQMGGKIKTTDRSVPPKLTEIVLQINSHGQIETTGLGTCSLAKLESVSAAAAKRSCSEALIGHGNVTSRVSLPEQGAFASNGALNAFNGTYKGQRAVFAQVESGPPLRLTYVIVFALKKTHGTFGTELVGTLPEIASEYGYITAFNLSLARRYTYRGRHLSYASASCPAPKGLTKVPFPMARASYIFADGRTLSATIEKTCTVRG
jgi:hypothetical protein